MKYDAKEIAINFIKPYALRGDGVDSILSGQGGQCGGGYSVQIGGYIWDTAIKTMVYKAKRDEVVVSEIGGKDCLFVFKVYKLYNEIRSGQMSLLGGD